MSYFCTCPADSTSPDEPETWPEPDPDCPEHGEDVSAFRVDNVDTAADSRGMTQTAAPQTLTAPFTADALRAADLNNTILLFRDGEPMVFASSLVFGLGSFEGDYESFAAYLTVLDRERAGEVG